MDMLIHHHHTIGHDRILLTIQMVRIGQAEEDGQILMEALQEEVEKDGAGMASMEIIKMARLSMEN